MHGNNALALNNLTLDTNNKPQRRCSCSAKCSVTARIQKNGFVLPEGKAIVLGACAKLGTIQQLKELDRSCASRGLPLAVPVQNSFVPQPAPSTLFPIPPPTT
jgi:hypothetical protein